ncbi:MAG: hypothetical protein ACI9SK_000978 [Zhongshania sp.]|jgi:hypothetical protein
MRAHQVSLHRILPITPYIYQIGVAERKYDRHQILSEWQASSLNAPFTNLKLAVISIVF